MTLLEICIDSFESALKAAEGGAHRLEICQDLSVGGVTPTAGFLSVIKKLVNIPVFVLIRPRPGNFQYNKNEVDQILEDIKIAKTYGADGLVFGALDKFNNVDFNVCQQLLAASSGLPVTFHRAFDQIINKTKALDDLISLGFQRILTAGGNETAFDGLQILQELVYQADFRIIIMPGGGIIDKNIYSIMKSTKASELHSSGRKAGLGSSLKSEFCCKDIVYNMRKILDENK